MLNWKLWLPLFAVYLALGYEVGSWYQPISENLVQATERSKMRIKMRHPASVEDIFDGRESSSILWYRAEAP